MFANKMEHNDSQVADLLSDILTFNTTLKKIDNAQ